MQGLAVPGRFKTICIPCGSFQCVRGRQAALETLRRCAAHLAPGGRLAFNVFLSDESYFTTTEFPQPRQPKAIKELSDGQRLEIDFRTTGIDVIEQIWQEERRYRLYVGDDLLQTEIHAGQGYWYYRNELLWMLQLAGFTDVQVPGDFTTEPFRSPDHGDMVFIARRP